MLQDSSEVDSRESVFRYPITKAREIAASILVKIMLTDETADEAYAHELCTQGREHALADPESLSPNCKVLLKGIESLYLDLAPNNSADAEHIMLSYCWAQQETVLRLKESLTTRGYLCWIDIEKMKGSTVDAMSEAVENAAVVLYGVSSNYKSSANCRLEAMYAHQQQKPMVPIMLEENYRATGWLGMILGARLW